MTPLRGSKGMLYEGGIRVPLIMCWPGVIEAGRENPTPVITLDFYPTLAAAAGASLPADAPIDGEDLTPLLRDDDAALETAVPGGRRGTSRTGAGGRGVSASTCCRAQVKTPGGDAPGLRLGREVSAHGVEAREDPHRFGRGPSGSLRTPRAAQRPRF